MPSILMFRRLTSDCRHNVDWHAHDRDRREDIPEFVQKMTLNDLYRYIVYEGFRGDLKSLLEIMKVTVEARD
jgi:hypothetical protein